TGASTVITVSPEAGGGQGLVASLRRMKLASAHTPIDLTPLQGGVSSDIFRADLPSGVVCVKRALSRLKVAAEWQAPVERSRYEVEWMRVAAGVVPNAVPPVLGEDRAAGAFAMAWYPPERYPGWKTPLRDGPVRSPSA